MLTKLFAGLVMAGALWVAGDAAYSSVGCCYSGSECCPSECCAAETSDCCSAGGDDCCAPVSACCVE